MDLPGILPCAQNNIPMPPVQDTISLNKDRLRKKFEKWKNWLSQLKNTTNINLPQTHHTSSPTKQPYP